MIVPAYKLLDIGLHLLHPPQIEVNVMLMSKRDVQPVQKVGIDVSAEKFDVEVQGPKGTQRAVFQMTPAGMKKFQNWLTRNQCSSPELWMESTGRYFEDLADWAYEQGWTVYTINPRCVRDFAKSRMQVSKSDPLDASIIRRFAESCTQNDYREWVPISDNKLELRDIQVAIKGFKKEIVRCHNRMKCGLKSEFAKARIKKIIGELALAIKDLHKQSMKLIREDSELSRQFNALIKIKGFGEVTVCFLLAKVDFFKFRKGRQLVKYAGLDVKQWQSGKSIRGKDCISRVGHADLRSAMYMPAMVAIKHDPLMAKIASAMAQRKVCNKVIICSVMARLLRVAFAVVRDSILANAA